MKVLVQYWTVYVGQELISISKDQSQLDDMIVRIQREDAENDNGKTTDPDGDAKWITIPDDSFFAEMVESETIFLDVEEQHVVWNSPEYKELFASLRTK